MAARFLHLSSPCVCLDALLVPQWPSRRSSVGCAEKGINQGGAYQHLIRQLAPKENLEDRQGFVGADLLVKVAVEQLVEFFDVVLIHFQITL